MSVELHFNNTKKTITGGKLLFEYARDIGINIHIPSSCGGQGTCKECIVEVTEGMDLLSLRQPEEEQLKENYRLACRCRIFSSTGTIRCNTLHRGSMKIFNNTGSIMHGEMKIDPNIIRSGKRILLDGDIIDESENEIYGIAADIGTTTVSLRLVNLETGILAAEYSFENPQRIGGTDVTSRIYFDSQNNSKLLQQLLTAYIAHAIEELSVDPSSIYEMVVSGNSVMRDIFFGLNVSPLGQYPYRSVTETDMPERKNAYTSLNMKVSELMLPVNPSGQIYGMPLISGHIGADAAAVMLAVDIQNEERLVAIMDIGTNTEIIIGNKNKIIAASCPAGPAFEGGRISCGMPALSGAIEHIKINPDGSFAIKIIDDKLPEGICGSGLIDLMGELLNHKLINNLGRFTDRLTSENDLHEDRIEIYRDNNNSVYITEKDISEVAKAKGANSAGLYTLCKNYGINFSDIDVFYIAGGFGNYINLDAAKRIGLLPDIDNSKFIAIGNASLEGANIALLSKTKRLELEEFVKKVIHCRLEEDPMFLEYFTEGCQFKPLKNNIILHD